MMVSKGKYGYLVKNTLLFGISQFGSKILTLLLVRLYTDVLSTSEYGVADLIITTSNVLVYVFTLEIASAVLRFAIERKERQGEILTYGLLIDIIGTGVLFGLSIICSKLRIFPLPSYFYPFLVLYFFGSSFGTTLSNYLRAIDEVRSCAIAGIISTIVLLSGNILGLLVFQFGIYGYLVSLVLSPLVGCFYMIMRVKKSGTLDLKSICDAQTRKEMRSYSIPLVFNGVGWWINNSLDKYFIIALLTSASNGIYAAAVKIPTILAVVQSVFSSAWNLSAIKEFDKDDADGFFQNTYAFYSGTLVLLISILILLNIPLAKFLFAKEFFIAWRCASILLISALFSALGAFLGSIFTAVKNSRIFAYSTITAAVINIVLNYVLICWIGLEGAAIATAISFAVMWLIRLICVKKIIRFRINIIRDCIAYALITAQVGADHMDTHGYEIQALILAFIVVLYYKEIRQLFERTKDFLWKK